MIFAGQKRAGSDNHFQASSLNPRASCQLNSDSNDDDGGDNKLGVRDASSMTAHNSSYSTVDRRYHSRVDSIRTGNRDSNSRLRPKRRHQNAARERKAIHLPSMQLREAFSSIFPFLVVVF